MNYTLKKGPELVLSVVTAATIFTSVVCNHWAVAIGVILMLDIASFWMRRIDAKKETRQDECRLEVGKREQKEGG